MGGFFSSIKKAFNRNAVAPEKENDASDMEDVEIVEVAAKDPDVQQVTEEHAQQVGVPKAQESPQPLSDEQMKNQEKAQESSGSGDSGDSGESKDKEESKSSNLIVKPYEGGKEEEENEKEESDLDDIDIVEVEGEKEEEKEADNFLSSIVPDLEKESDDRIKLNAFNRARNKIGLYNYSKEERKKIGRQYKQNVSKDERAWMSALHSSRYKDKSGKTQNFFERDTLDKVQLGLDISAGITSAASSGVGMFKDDSFLGKKLGVGKDTSDRLDKASAGISLASDSLKLASGGISIYKDIKEIRENDEFTTGTEKVKQGLSLASDLLSFGSDATSMGSTISELAGGKEAATGFTAASKAMGSVSDALSTFKAAITIGETSANIGDLEDVLKKGNNSEEFNKLANVALKANKLQRTSAGFDLAKSFASFVGNWTGTVANIGKGTGLLDENSTMGQVLKWTETISSGIGTGLGFLGKGVSWLQKKNRKESDIDAFIDTPNLRNKINSITNYNLSNKQTRKVAKTILGYKSSDEMYSAILLNYAATIRTNAQSGPEKEKYRFLIENLGFKLKGNSGLPSVEAIAQKLAATD